MSVYAVSPSGGAGTTASIYRLNQEVAIGTNALLVEVLGAMDAVRSEAPVSRGTDSRSNAGPCERLRQPGNERSPRKGVRRQWGILGGHSPQPPRRPAQPALPAREQTGRWAP